MKLWREVFVLSLGTYLLSGCGGGSMLPPTPGASLSTDAVTFTSESQGPTGQAQSFTLSNTGRATLKIASIAATGDFAQTNTCGATLAPGATCVITTTFSPGSGTGDSNGKLLVTDNAADSPQTVMLSGGGWGHGGEAKLDGFCFALFTGDGCTVARVTSPACPAGKQVSKREVKSVVCNSEGSRGNNIIDYEAGSRCVFHLENKVDHVGQCEVNP